MKPVRLPNDVFDWVIGHDAPETAMQLARDTSWALLDRVREHPEHVERVLAHARTHGIDDIAELWASAHPETLAGVLWRLYLLRQAVSADPQGSALQFERGTAAGTVDPVIAGAREPISPESVQQLCDTILRGAFVGDFAAALERAWAYARVMAHGAASLADDRDNHDDAHAASLTRRAYRYTQIAECLHRAARLWRSNSLG